MEAGEIAQPKGLLCKHLILRTKAEKAGMVAWTCDASAEDGETGS